MSNENDLPVAVAQFTVTREPERNLDIIDKLARDAAAEGARLLVLPEGLIARDGDDNSFAAAHAQPAKPAPMTRMSVSTVDVTSVMGSGTTSHAYCVSPPAAALPAASPPALAAGEQPARPAPAATAAVAPRPRNARRDSPFFMMSVIGNPFPR